MSHHREPTVEEVLDGTASYDDLSDADQATVRGVWAERIRDLRGGLDLTPELDAAGVAYSIADEDGRVITVQPGEHAE